MSTVSILTLGVTLMFVVVLHVFLGVGIAESVWSQFPATPLAARFLCLVGHLVHLTQRKKPPRIPATALLKFW